MYGRLIIMSDPFGHRKYHSLYFILGFLIAVVLVSVLSGCERGKDSKGRACTSVVGVGITGDACEPEDVWIDRPPVQCCMALTPSCEACQEGISLPEWIVNTCGPEACNVEYAGWDEDNNEPIWLCQAVIIN